MPAGASKRCSRLFQALAQLAEVPVNPSYRVDDTILETHPGSKELAVVPAVPAPVASSPSLPGRLSRWHDGFRT